MLFFLVCWVALGCVPTLVLKSLCLLVDADSDSRLNGEEAVSLAWLVVGAASVCSKVRAGALMAFSHASLSSPCIHTHVFYGAKNKVAGHKQGTDGALAPLGPDSSQCSCPGVFLAPCYT